jgi:hypothetical protein
MNGYALLALFGTLMLILIRWANRTDIPKIKNLPELPGVPIFGSLFLLGEHHARNCARLAREHGEVFQVRLGYRVGVALVGDQDGEIPCLTVTGTALRLCQYIRVRQRAVDQKPIRPRFSAQILDLP